VVIRFFDGVIELMDSCCVNKACALEQLRERQERPSESFSSTTLRLFAIALIAGLIAGSAALLADSLDGLGDALVYGFSLYVMGRAVLWKVRAALRGHGFVRRFRAGQLVYKLLFPQIPAYETMGALGRSRCSSTRHAARRFGAIATRTSICVPSGSVPETTSSRTCLFCWHRSPLGD
jgi:hypothetical protein